MSKIYDTVYTIIQPEHDVLSIICNPFINKLTKINTSANGKHWSAAINKTILSFTHTHTHTQIKN